jgi:hypothetical protein
VVGKGKPGVGHGLAERFRLGKAGGLGAQRAWQWQDGPLRFRRPGRCVRRRRSSTRLQRPRRGPRCPLVGRPPFFTPEALIGKHSGRRHKPDHEDTAGDAGRWRSDPFPPAGLFPGRRRRRRGRFSVNGRRLRRVFYTRRWGIRSPRWQRGRARGGRWSLGRRVGRRRVGRGCPPARIRQLGNGRPARRLVGRLGRHLRRAEPSRLFDAGRAAKRGIVRHFRRGVEKTALGLTEIVQQTLPIGNVRTWTDSADLRPQHVGRVGDHCRVVLADGNPEKLVVVRRPLAFRRAEPLEIRIEVSHRRRPTIVVLWEKRLPPTIVPCVSRIVGMGPCPYTDSLPPPPERPPRVYRSGKIAETERLGR